MNKDTKKIGIHVPTMFGIVVSKDACMRLNIDTSRLLRSMEVDVPFDEDQDLISFGPHFGEAASDFYLQNLQRLGLVYFEDFFVLSLDVPQWCQISVTKDPANDNLK